MSDAPDEGNEKFILRLFVTGTTVRSQHAIANMRRICEDYLSGRYDLEVIDVYQEPEKTRDMQIIAAPTLVKVLPEPLRKFIGDLADHDKILAGLNLTPVRGGKGSKS